MKVWSVVFCRYRPPDVLLGSTEYSTSIDMWYVFLVFPIEVNTKKRNKMKIKKLMVCAHTFIYIVAVFLMKEFLNYSTIYESFRLIINLIFVFKGCGLHLLWDGMWPPTFPWFYSWGWTASYIQDAWDTNRRQSPIYITKPGLFSLQLPAIQGGGSHYHSSKVRTQTFMLNTMHTKNFYVF